MAHHQRTTGAGTLTGQHTKRGPVRNETRSRCTETLWHILRPRKETQWIDPPPPTAPTHSPPTYFPIFPLSRVANLFTHMSVVIISAGDERFWLVDSGQKALEEYSIRYWEASSIVMRTVHMTQFCGLSITHQNILFHYRLWPWIALITFKEFNVFFDISVTDTVPGWQPTTHISKMTPVNKLKIL